MSKQVEKHTPIKASIRNESQKTGIKTPTKAAIQIKSQRRRNDNDTREARRLGGVGMRGAGVGLECYAGKLDFVNGRTATYAVIDSHYLNIDSLGTGLKKTRFG